MFVNSVNFIVNTCDIKKRKNISSTAERSSKVTPVVIVDSKTLLAKPCLK